MDDIKRSIDSQKQTIRTRRIINRLRSIVGLFGVTTWEKVGYCLFLQLAHPAQLRRITNTVRATMFVRCWRA